MPFDFLHFDKRIKTRGPFVPLGIILISFGLAIVLFPRLLVILVASFFIFLGIIFLSLGRGMGSFSSRREDITDAKFYE